MKRSVQQGWQATAMRGAWVLAVLSIAGCSTISSAYHSTTDTVGGWFGIAPSPKKPEEPKPELAKAPAPPPDAVIPATLPQALVGVGDHPPYIPGSRPVPVVKDTVAAVAPIATPTAQTLSPEAAACVAAAKGKAVTSVPFVVGSTRIDAAGVALLQQVLAGYKQHPGAKVQVLGNASDQGTDNQAASEKRAQAAEAALEAMGIPAAALCMAGLGDTKPLYAETSDQDKAANQRADVSLSF